jgi:MFS family permease
VGLGSAQFLLVLASPQSTAPFMLVSALISAAMVPIVASAQEVAGPAIPQRVRFRDLYRNSPLGVVAVAFSGMISSIIFSMGPVYARLSGFGTRGVAEFMAVSIFAAVLTQYPVGRLSDRMDRRTVIASMCLLAALVAAAIEVFGPLPRFAFLALAALFSGAALTLYSLSVSHVNDKLDPSQMVAASSALLLINGTAAAFGPAIAGGLMAAFGARAYFGVLGGLAGTLTMFDLWRKLRRGPVPQSQKGPFINTRELVTSAGLEPAPAPGVEPLEPTPAREAAAGVRAAP